MSRPILILLALMLSLQSAWAVASSYCAHEGDQAPWHFGHHEHGTHLSAQDESGAGSGSSSLVLDQDCANCHTGACHFLALTGAPLHPLADLAALASSQIQRLSSSPPTRPERPKWAAFA